MPAPGLPAAARRGGGRAAARHQRALTRLTVHAARHAPALCSARTHTQSLPAYKQAWELVASTGSSLHDVWVVRKFLEVGYPLLAPVADPVVSNITNSKYLKQLQSHLAPAKKA